MSSDLSKIEPAIPIEEADIYANVDLLKKIRDEFEDLMLIDSAQFFTDKLITLADDVSCKDEVYRMAKILHEKEEFHRAAFYITSRNFHLHDLSCRYLAAKCYFDCEEYTKALEISNLPTDSNITFNEKHGNLNQWKSSLELLKGNIHESTNNRLMANKCFLEALRLDIFCFEAFQSLIHFDMLSKDEEKELLTILEANGDKFSNGENFIKYFYNSELNKNDKYNNVLLNINQRMNFSDSRAVPSSDLEVAVNTCSDTQLNQAEQNYNNCEFRECYEIVSKVYDADLYNPKCLLLMVGCLMELNKPIVLQEIAHKLVEIYPENPISWYAVGCYYYLISNPDNARKYFSKSTAMDGSFQPSMLMYGHSFEMESLHDKAISVYLDLSKVMPRSFLPLLYVGVEYSHMNNATMAELYINKALELSNNDMFVLHELAIVYFQKKDYAAAKKYFYSVYEILAAKHLMLNFPQKWEPLLNNLGHVCRKMGQYDESISYHKQALRLIPQNASTYDALGLVHSLNNSLQMACDCFQKALSLKRDDAFAMTMHNIVYQDIIEKEINQSMMDLKY